MSFIQALQGLMGGPQQRDDYQDFVNRYQQGPPAEGYSDQEVQQRYGRVASQLPPQDYQQAAQAAFERMSPQEREQFAQQLHQRAQQQGVDTGGTFGGGGYGQYQDAGTLARTTTQVHQQAPDLLGQLLGPGGALGNPIAKAALAGVAAMAASRFLSGHR